MPSTAKAPSHETVQRRLDAARLDLSKAVAELTNIASCEDACLASDAEYIGWSRRMRVAQNQHDDLVRTVALLETEVATADQARTVAAFDARYNAIADRNAELAKQFDSSLADAWDVIAEFLSEAAKVEIETEAVRAAMPPGYRPKRRLVEFDFGTRCRPAASEEIVSSTVEELWVSRETGHIFSNQAAPPKDQNASKRSFRVIAYTPFRRGDQVAPFTRSLVFPRLGSFGEPLFDGSKVRTPHDVLKQLSAQRDNRTEPTVTLKKIEAI